MSYYLAASYSRREEINRYARWLTEHAGLHVVSTWHDGHHELVGAEDTDAYRAMCAKEDLFDLDDADVLLFFSGKDEHRGGRHTEYGYALSRHKTIFIIGQVENIFHTLATQRFDSFQHFALDMWGAVYDYP